MRGALRRRRFRTDSEQFPVKHRQAKEFYASMAPDAEEAVCTPSKLVFHLTVFLFGSQFAVYLSFLWCRTGTEAM